MNVILKATVVAVAAVLVVACSGEQAGVRSPGGGAPPAASGGPANPESGAETAPVPGQGGAVGDELNNPESPLHQRVVYFDFDKSDIKDEAKPVLDAHASYLASHPDVHVTLEGNTDERGTREYNMALGERRAKAVYQYLTLQGVAPSQLKIISYGEERPAALGHDESAWSKNRRVELDYGNS
jgi:peptidoglycan-associated lipoprotein